ncbi:DUF5591 domain-containing protein [Desulfurococcaceae archaeon MEX13E-LK6-19]|nr:DUF5591 domain-containing protein [Desulfurococcaceae archaeon MEX13E-LK6-19]
MGNKKGKEEKLEVIWDGKELDWVKPDTCREYLRGVGLKYLVNKYFEEGFKKILTNYRPKKKYIVGLIIPCSYGKPYSQSYIHYFIRKAIKDFILKEYVHEIIVTNAGVVPRELDEYWPYCAYDWNPKYETNEIKKMYTKVLASRLKTYIETFREYYTQFAAYLRWDSDSWKAVEIVSNELGIKIPNLAPSTIPAEELEEVRLGGLYDDPDLVLITHTSLSKLRENLAKLVDLSKSKKKT